jgi:hypothetical protein
LPSTGSDGATANSGTSGSGSGSGRLGVLFYGYVTSRRRAILESLERAGLDVSYGYAFGARLRALIASADVVINLHQEDGVALEVSCDVLAVCWAAIHDLLQLQVGHCSRL